MFLKANGHALPAPYQTIQMCEVMLALQNDREMQLVKSRCDTMKYECKLTMECPWLPGNEDDSDSDFEGA